MATLTFASGRADEIYRTGPEVLTAQSSTILAGPVSSYSKQVLTSSQPAGPDAVPLTWVVTGRLENPSVLKGMAQGPRSFSRNEHSVFIPAERNRERWEEQYGDVSPEGRVVLFLSGDPKSPQIKALPSGTDERDLAAIVRDFVAIQAMEPQAQEAAWLAYLERSRTDEGRQAALRSLLRAKIDWNHLGPALDRFSANPSLTETIRGYAFGIVVFGLTEGLWTRSGAAIGQYLCRQFATPPADDEDLLLDYLLKFKTLLQYTTEEANKAARAPLRTTVGTCLKSRESSLKGSPDLAEQYREIRDAYPGVL